jgi:hypothetical protein
MMDVGSWKLESTLQKVKRLCVALSTQSKSKNFVELCVKLRGTLCYKLETLNLKQKTYKSYNFMLNVHKRTFCVPKPETLNLKQKNK